ncbi:mitochondrial transcription factor 1 [Monosporozyma unispora]|nr:Mitochondrial transcription factor 1 [Kazachstania unispora]
MALRIPTLAEISTVKHSYRFQYLINQTICDKIFTKLQLDKTYPNNLKDLKVLDLYPGPAVQSAVFNNRFTPKQHLLMESRKSFAEFQDRYLIPYDNSNHLTMIRKDPYDWSSFTDLIDKEKKFQPEVQSRNHIHNEFLIMGNVTEKKYEGLIIQWLNCLGYKNWLMKFGNVKMLLWLPTQTAVKLLALPGTKHRNKCSLYLEAFANTNIVALSHSEHIKDFDKKLIEKSSPVLIDNSDAIFPINSKDAITLLEINPKDHAIDVDTWDYVTKQLMILRGTPLLDAVESLGHGAREYYLEKLTDKSLMERCPATFTYDEFLYIIKLFKAWPFKPDIYLELYDIKIDEFRN